MYNKKNIIDELLKHITDEVYLSKLLTFVDPHITKSNNMMVFDGIYSNEMIYLLIKEESVDNKTCLALSLIDEK